MEDLKESLQQQRTEAWEKLKKIQDDKSSVLSDNDKRYLVGYYYGIIDSCDTLYNKLIPEGCDE